VIGTTALATAALIALFVSNALAVHDLKFQLDGNADEALCGTVPVNCTTAQVYDWGSNANPAGANRIFNADTTVNTNVVKDTNGSGGFTTAAFQRDFGVKVSASDSCNVTNTTATVFCTKDPTTFATGSKDIQNIGGGGADQSGNWQCNRDNNVNSKIDIMNAYSAVYIDPTSKDKILYFALEKNKDNGNNNAAFWFLQGDSDCSSPGGAVNFSGNHKDGDILVTSAFTSGGGVSSILVFRWAGGSNGCIDSNPNAAPACDQQPIGSGGDCKTAQSTSGTPPADTICATTNSGTLPTNQDITVPWLTSDATAGVGHKVVPPDFFEGGIDLTKAFAQSGSGTVPSCFNTFIADTRSSQSPTATLFDFARGSLGECKTTLTTKAGDTANGGSGSPTSIGGGSVSSGSDTATLTVTGAQSWGGKLTWYLCGPVSSDGCDNTGVKVTDRTVSNSSPATDFVSDTATLTSAGRYCWTTHFAPDTASAAAGVKAADDDGANECFTVAKAAPSLSTQAVIPNPTPPPAYVNVPVGYKTPFGSAVYDTGTLSNAAKEPGSGGPSSAYPTINPTTAGVFAGTIGFTLKGPDGGGASKADPNCTDNAVAFSGTTPTSFPINKSVTGNVTYGADGSINFTPDTPGTYHWVATYSNTGSANNTQPVNFGCPTVNGVPVPDASEAVTVEQIPTDIRSKQSWYPNDTATVCSGNCTTNNGSLVSGGTLDFYLYNSADCTAGTNDVNLKYSQRISVGSGATQEKSTTNYPGGSGTAVPAGETPHGTGTWAAFPVDTAYGDIAGSAAGGLDPNTGAYSWLIKYTPPDSAHTGSSSSCASAAHTEQFSTTYTNDNGH
jgi:hypothetical protein